MFQKYTRVALIGKGTFGEVHKAKITSSNPIEYVAMKRIIMEKETEGFPITALREIKILKSLKHRNIVQLKEVCRQAPNEANRYTINIYLIFEFCHHDLAGLLSTQSVTFTEPQIKGRYISILFVVKKVTREVCLYRYSEPTVCWSALFTPV